MSAYRLQLAASGAVLLASIAFATPPAIAAPAKVCRSQEQRFEQIERDPTSIEINAALFSAADKACTDLARKLLELGASLEARDRTGTRPLARAAVAGEV